MLNLEKSQLLNEKDYHLILARLFVLIPSTVVVFDAATIVSQLFAALSSLTLLCLCMVFKSI